MKKLSTSSENTIVLLVASLAVVGLLVWGARSISIQWHGDAATATPGSVNAQSDLNVQPPTGGSNPTTANPQQTASPGGSGASVDQSSQPSLQPAASANQANSY